MALDRDTVRTIATLARIRVPDDQLDPLAAELSQILHWVEQLGEVDTDNVAPMTSVAEVALPRRIDAISDGGSADKVLSNAPDRVDGFFAVPKVVE